MITDFNLKNKYYLTHMTLIIIISLILCVLNYISLSSVCSTNNFPKITNLENIWYTQSSNLIILSVDLLIYMIDSKISLFKSHFTRKIWLECSYCYTLMPYYINLTKVNSIEMVLIDENVLFVLSRF